MKRWADPARLGRPVFVLALILTALVFLRAHRLDSLHPTRMLVRNGFWWWNDQYQYLKGALAWARGDLDPAQHWYLPGYPLLAVPFVCLGGGDPFMIPDLICLLATVACCAEVARLLSPGRQWAFLLGALGLVATIILSPWFRRCWVIPWSTTPTAPLSLACMLLVFRFQDAPRPLPAFLIGATASAVALFRPTDALVLLIVVPPFVAASSIGRSAREIASIVRAGVIGGFVPLMILTALHVAVHGYALGAYLRGSASTGFEWRLVPLRWVTIVVSPRGVFRDGEGLAQGFVWVVPGFAALVAGAAGLLGGRIRRHLFVAAFVATDMALYLGYRDLHPQGLWKFNNYHYFRSVLCILVIYCALLAAALVMSGRRTVILATMVVCVVALFGWRAEWRPSRAAPTPVVTGPHTVAIIGGLRSPLDAMLVPADGTFNAIYSGDYHLRVRNGKFTDNIYSKSIPIPGGIFVEPLRPVGPGSEIFTTDPRVVLRDMPKPVVGRLRATFGLPCWFHSTTMCGAGVSISG